MHATAVAGSTPEQADGGLGQTSRSDLETTLNSTPPVTTLPQNSE